MRELSGAGVEFIDENSALVCACADVSDDKNFTPRVQWTLEYAGVDFLERLRLHQQAIAASTLKPHGPDTPLNCPANYPDDIHTLAKSLGSFEMANL